MNKPTHSFTDTLTLEQIMSRCMELLQTQSPHTPTNLFSLEPQTSGFRHIAAETMRQDEELEEAYSKGWDDCDTGEPHSFECNEELPPTAFKKLKWIEENFCEIKRSDVGIYSLDHSRAPTLEQLADDALSD